MEEMQNVVCHAEDGEYHAGPTDRQLNAQKGHVNKDILHVTKW